MWLVLFMPWAMIGAFGCTARNSFHTDACAPENSAFNTILSGTSNSLNSWPTRVTPRPIAQLVEKPHSRGLALRGSQVRIACGTPVPGGMPNSLTKKEEVDQQTFLPTGQVLT